VSSYTVYDKATGEIIKSGVAPDDMIELQLTDPAKQGLVIGRQVNDQHFTIDPRTRKELKRPEQANVR